MPSNLTSTTRECVHTCSHFRSRDKDGGHTIRSAVAVDEKSMLHVNCMALCLNEIHSVWEEKISIHEM